MVSNSSTITMMHGPINIRFRRNIVTYNMLCHPDICQVPIKSLRYADGAKLFQANPRIGLIRRFTVEIVKNFCLDRSKQMLIFCWPCISIHLFININQLNALNFVLSLFQAPTCFEHMCSSSGGQIVLYSLWYHHTYRCDDTRDCIIHL